MAKRRTKRDVFMEPTDPKFPQQWYLVSAGGGGRWHPREGCQAAAASQAGEEEEEEEGLRPQPYIVSLGKRMHVPCWGAGSRGSCPLPVSEAGSVPALPAPAPSPGAGTSLPQHRELCLWDAGTLWDSAPFLSALLSQPCALCKTPMGFPHPHGTAESRAKAAFTDGSGGACTPRSQRQQLDIADNVRASFGSTTPTSGT